LWFGLGLPKPYIKVISPRTSEYHWIGERVSSEVIKIN
jgi:hypothetical protein